MTKKLNGDFSEYENEQRPFTQILSENVRENGDLSQYADELLPVEHQRGKSQFPSKKERVWKLRHSVPFVPINTLPDDSRCFYLVANQVEEILIPHGATLFMITCSNTANLIAAPNGIPAVPPTAVGFQDNGAYNLDNLPPGLVNISNVLFDAVGVNSIGLLSNGADNYVSLWFWKENDNGHYA